MRTHRNRWRVTEVVLSGLLTVAGATAAGAQGISNFATPQTYISNGAAVDGPSMFWSAAADFNGDGRVDLAAPDNRALNNLLGFSIAFGQPGGGYAAPVARSIGAYVRTLRAADLNHDGCADLVVVTLGGALVLPGSPDGTFGAPLGIPLPLVANDVAFADFNGDGQLDIVAPGDLGYAVALGLGNGTFSRGRLFPEAIGSYWVVTGDFNGDGKQDFIGPGGIGSQTYLGNGDGSFQAPFFGGVVFTSAAAAADFNNDGNVDLAMLTSQ